MAHVVGEQALTNLFGCFPEQRVAQLEQLKTFFLGQRRSAFESQSYTAGEQIL